MPLSKEFSEFIRRKRILIADPSGAARAGLAKALIDLGAKPQNIVMTPSFEVAQEEITSNKPEIILADFELGERCGLDLFHEMKKVLGDSETHLFVLVTANTSQTAVAQAAEEDVDAFLLKPYTIQTVAKTLIQLAREKLLPDPYHVIINEAKVLIDQKKYNDALSKLQEATKLDPKPTLVHYYTATVHRIENRLDLAEASLREALKYQPNHFKSLLDLYEILFETKQFAGAYPIAKSIIRKFPTNNERLSAVLKLSVITKSFEDIDQYYALFIALKIRTEELTKHMSAALVIAGKINLKMGHKGLAVEFYRNAANTSLNSPKVLKEIIADLTQGKMPQEALGFFERFGPLDRKTPEFIESQKLVKSG